MDIILVMTNPTSPRLTLLPQTPAGKRTAIRRYKLGRVVRDVDVGDHMLPDRGAARPAAFGVRAP